MQCIGEIRKVLNDKNHQLVKTFPRKGYLVSATPVSDTEPATTSAARGLNKKSGLSRWHLVAGSLVVFALVLSGFLLTNLTGNPSELGDKPKIAILPFNDLSIGSNKGHLSDAIAEGVISEMSRHGLIEVVARNSSFRYRDRDIDTRQISRDLGVHYVLEGNQQINNDKLRVSVRLVDATDATNIWSNTYNVELTDFFIVQDAIIKTVSDRIGRKIERPVPSRDSNKVSALDYHLQGRQLIRTDLNPENAKKGIELNELAIETDPDSHYGHLGLARYYRKIASFGWLGFTKEKALNIGFEHAKRAIKLAPESADVHFVLAQLHTNRNETSEALARIAKAIELNPSNSNYLAYSSTPLLYIGKTDEAIDNLQTAMGIDPFHPDWFHWNMGWALWEKNECEGALKAMKSMTKIPQVAHRMLSVIYACLGDRENSRTAYKTFNKDLKERTIAEERSLWEKVWTAEGSLDRWLEHLRIAGMKD